MHADQATYAVAGERTEALLTFIGCPTRPCESGIDESLLGTMLHATKDIRDKYVLSRLAFDLGVIDELPL